MTTKTTMKNLARSLGKALKAKGHAVPHSVLLHAIAASGGETNWHVVVQKSDAGAVKAPSSDGTPAMRGVLMSCIDMLEECQRYADNDTADMVDTVLLSARSALKAEAVPPLSTRLMAAARLVLSSWEKGDLAQAVRELEAAVREAQALRASNPALGALAIAARELLDAFGGNTPDWLRTEAIKLEDALEAEKQTQPLDHWGEDHGYPIEDWQYEVANGDTRLGYWQWVTKRKDEDEHPPKAGPNSPMTAKCICNVDPVTGKNYGVNPDCLKCATPVPKHVCGLMGYNPMLGDTCPACSARSAQTVALNAPYEAIKEVQRRADARMRKVSELLNSSKAKAEPQADPECECGNCAAVWLRSELNEAKDLDERLEFPIGHPDCVEPDGECPDCGALCYEIESRQERPSLLLAARAVVEDYDTTGCEDCGVVSQKAIDALKAAFDAWGPGPVQETALVVASRGVLESYDTTGCEDCGTVDAECYVQLQAAVMSLRS